MSFAPSINFVLERALRNIGAIPEYWRAATQHPTRA